MNSIIFQIHSKIIYTKDMGTLKNPLPSSTKTPSLKKKKLFIKVYVKTYG